MKECGVSIYSFSEQLKTSKNAKDSSPFADWLNLDELLRANERNCSTAGVNSQHKHGD